MTQYQITKNGKKSDNDDDDDEHKNKTPLQNVTNVYVNAYDCCVSYNPIPTSERLVIACEKIKISTNVVALSPMVSVSLNVMMVLFIYIQNH